MQYGVKFMEGQTVWYPSEAEALEHFEKAHRQFRWGLREEEPMYLGEAPDEELYWSEDPEDYMDWEGLEDELEEVAEEEDPTFETQIEEIGETSLGLAMHRYTTVYRETGELFSVEEEYENELGGYNSREIYKNGRWA